MRCGLIQKLTDIKEKFLEKNKGYRFGIADDVEEFLFTSRSVAVTIENEEIKNGQRTVSLSFYFSENFIKNGVISFREKVNSFIEFLDDNENYKFNSFKSTTNIEYGNIEDETKRVSLRTAVIKKTYDITNLLIDIDDEEYEKMSSNIYLEL